MEGRLRVCLDAGSPEELLGESEPTPAADDDRLVPSVGKCCLVAHATVPHAHDPVGDARRLRVVADEHRCRPSLAGELDDRLVDPAGVRSVELAGRLVREQEPRAMRERGADRNALLLASGELARMGLRAVE